MKRNKIFGILLCVAILLEACGSMETEKKVQMDMQNDTVSTEQSVTEETNDIVPITEQSVTEETNDIVPITEQKDESGSITIEIGPDKKIQDESGTIIFNLYDFKLYDSPQSASIDEKNINAIDASYYMDRSKFLTLKVDIYNVDYSGSDDGSINVSMFTIAPNQQDDTLEWAGSYPVYLSEPGIGTEYYHVFIDQGETKTITLGFYVPVKDIEELSSQCKICMFDNYEDGYIYEIPTILY